MAAKDSDDQKPEVEENEHNLDMSQAAVKRMIALMDEAKARGADLIVYPELALTTFFPRWYMEDQAEVDTWFEREMPSAAIKPLFERAARHRQFLCHFTRSAHSE